MFLHAKIIKHSVVKLLDSCFIERIELHNEAGTGCDLIVCCGTLSALGSLDYEYNLQSICLVEIVIRVLKSSVRIICT
jgi:hypothetical protein